MLAYGRTSFRNTSFGSEAFQGAFHMNPDYTLWYGWNEMVQDLDEIKAMAAEMRAHHESG